MRTACGEALTSSCVWRVGLKAMPAKGLGRYSVWKGSTAPSWLPPFGESGTSHSCKVPDAYPEVAATTIRGFGLLLDRVRVAVAPCSEADVLTKVIARELAGHSIPASGMMVSPHFPFPALPATSEDLSSGLSLLAEEGGVKGSVMTEMSFVEQDTVKTIFC